MTKTAYYETFKKAYIAYIEKNFAEIDAEKMFKKYIGGMKKFYAAFDCEIETIHKAEVYEVEECAQNCAYEDAEIEMNVA